MRRISIRTLMAFVLVSAVGLAALRNASELWAGIMLLLALAAAGAAILGAALMQGGERAWWLGFAVFGGGYLVVALGPVRSELAITRVLSYVHSRVDAQSDYDAMTARLASLRVSLLALKQSLYALKFKNGVANQATPVTSASNDPPIAGLLESEALLESKIKSLESDVMAMVAKEPPIDRWSSVFPGATNLDAFQRVGHSLFALLSGLVGGTVALSFWERRKREEAGSADGAGGGRF